MPKIVDHDERRTDIVRAIIKVVGEGGLAGATVRSIAREGGFSSGVIAHYFANKDEMVRYAFEFVADRVFRRIDARLKQAVGGQSGSGDPRRACSGKQAGRRNCCLFGLLGDGAA